LLVAAILLAAFVLAPREPEALAGGKSEDIDWKGAFPEAELTRLVADSVKSLQDATRSPTNWNSKGLKDSFAENEAYVLVLYAEAGIKSGNADLANRATGLHHTALKLAQSCKDKNLDEAKKLVAVIDKFKTMKPEGDGKVKGLAEAIPVKNLMIAVGKQEEALKAYRRLTPAQFNAATKPQELTSNSLRMTAMTCGITAHVPAKDEDAKKTKKLWLDTTAETREATLEMAAAAKAKKLPDFKTALNKMSDACVKCHDVYRKKDD
jgi:hypothetical protein